MILLDVSRFLNKWYDTSPTGIDRVTFNYLGYFLHEYPKRAAFVQQKSGKLVVINKDYIRELYANLVDNWGIRDQTPPDYRAAAARIISQPELYREVIGRRSKNEKPLILAPSDSAMLYRFYSQDYQQRIELLKNTDLKSLLGGHFGWVETMPAFFKNAVFSGAARSKFLAYFYLKTGRLLGQLFSLGRIKATLEGISYKYRYSRNIEDLESALKDRVPGETVLFLNTSHYLLLEQNVLSRYAELYDLRYIFFIHDLLQIEVPELHNRFSYPVFKKFIDNVIALNASLIFNSRYTENSFREYTRRENLKYTGSLLVDHIGVDPHIQENRGQAGDAADTVYFVFLSTIQARKNHILLLEVWRDLFKQMNDKTPRLLFIGERGWGSEAVVDMIRHTPELDGKVFELNDIDDALMLHILGNARALLFPSLYEGWGMPVVEALSMNLPVVCSDIPALREAGQDIPDYISPHDRKQWLDAVVDYTGQDSLMRASQLERIKGFRMPAWKQHFGDLSTFIDRISSHHGNSTSVC